MSLPRTWVEVSASLFHSNIASIKRRVGEQKIVLSVKSNAYGHGLALIGNLAQENSDIFLLCTAHGDEALFLRKAGIKKPILNMAYGDRNEIAECIRHGIALSIMDASQAHTVISIAEQINHPVMVHVHVDTALHRWELPWAPIEQIAMLKKHPLVVIAGVFILLADKNDGGEGYAQEHLRMFDEIIARLAERGILFPLAYAISSHLLAEGMPSSCSAVYLGTAAYGSSTVHQQDIEVPEKNGLESLLTWKTRVMQIKQVEAGVSIGYSCTYQTTHPTLIAVLPVGYWDGYARGLSNKGHVVVKDNWAPVLGIVSMNLVVVDVSHIPGVSVGDEVTLLGSINGITVSDLADMLGTINSEITTRINPAIPRMLVS